jgi:hypothetical protein
VSPVMIGLAVHGRICAWPGTEAQSDSVIGFADVTSHEHTTRKWFEKWGTNRGLRPTIRTCSTSGDLEEAADCSQGRRSDSSAAADRRQALPCRPSIVAEKWLAARAVKAASRAQRGRSETEDARSALSARVASRTICRRRPL